MTITKSLNPLHFEDLEPYRFEDLIRQVVYDFRQWKSIEATGRLGSDDGIDIRAFEIIGLPQSSDSEVDEEVTAIKEAAAIDHLWIIQCKREKSVGPKKIRNIVNNNLNGLQGQVYGYILAAACDFSKTARDAFREELLKYDVQEFYIWGKSDLEDMLFLPKNDHLLFAYFGISLQVRRRSIKTQISSRLSLKRKLIKELGELRQQNRKPVLIRDPRDEEYPKIVSVEGFLRAPRWRYWWFRAHQPPDHVAFITKSHFAYLDWEKKEWDILADLDVGIPNYPELHGIDRRLWDKDQLDSKYRKFWLNKIPEQNRAWATEISLISYDRILALDEIGDAANEGPHLLVEYYPDGNPFEPRVIYLLEPLQGYQRYFLYPDKGTQIKFFPKVIPDELNDS